MSKYDYKFLKRTSLPNIITICCIVQLLFIVISIPIHLENFIFHIAVTIFCIAITSYTIYFIKNRKNIIVKEFSICFFLNIMVAICNKYKFSRKMLFMSSSDSKMLFMSSSDIVSVLDFVVPLLNCIMAIGIYYLFIKHRRKASLCVLLVLQIIMDSAMVILPVVSQYSRMHEAIALRLPVLFMHFILLLFILAIDNKPNKEYILIPASNAKAIRHRRIGICLFLSLFSFGIYYIYWNYKIVKDIRKLSKQKGGVGEFLLIVFVPFYEWYWVCSRGNRLSVIAQNNRIRSTGSGISYLVLNIFFLKIVTMCLIQDTLNNLADIMDENFIYGDTMRVDNYTPYMNSPTYGQPVQGTQLQITQNDIEILKQLNELKNQGIITEEEYIRKKEEIIR